MPAETVFCHVLGGSVTVVTDLNGTVTNVVCPAYSRVFQTCEKKGETSGFLGRVAKRMMDKQLGTRERFCEFAPQDDLL